MIVIKLYDPLYSFKENLVSFIYCKTRASSRHNDDSHNIAPVNHKEDVIHIRVDITFLIGRDNFNSVIETQIDLNSFYIHSFVSRIKRIAASKYPRRNKDFHIKDKIIKIALKHLLLMSFKIALYFFA